MGTKGQLGDWNAWAATTAAAMRATHDHKGPVEVPSSPAPRDQMTKWRDKSEAPKDQTEQPNRGTKTEGRNRGSILYRFLSIKSCPSVLSLGFVPRFGPSVWSLGHSLLSIHFVPFCKDFCPFLSSVLSLPIYFLSLLSLHFVPPAYIIVPPFGGSRPKCLQASPARISGAGATPYFRRYSRSSPAR